MHYLAGMMGFFILGLLLFIAPVLVIDEFASSIPFDTSIDDLIVINLVGSFLLGILWCNFYKIQNHWLFDSLRKLPYAKQVVSNVDAKTQRLDDMLSEFHKCKSQLDFFSAYLLASSQEEPERHEQIIKKMGLSSYDEKHFHNMNDVVLNLKNDVDELKSFVEKQKESPDNYFQKFALSHNTLKTKEDYENLNNKIDSLESRFKTIKAFFNKYDELLKKLSGAKTFLKDSKSVEDSERFILKDD